MYRIKYGFELIAYESKFTGAVCSLSESELRQLNYINGS